MDRTVGRAFFFLLFSASLLSGPSEAQETNAAAENGVQEAPAIKPVAAIYPEPGGSVPLDSFHKKSQYIIVASKIIRPNTHYQVGLISMKNMREQMYYIHFKIIKQLIFSTSSIYFSKNVLQSFTHFKPTHSNSLLPECTETQYKYLQRKGDKKDFPNTIFSKCNSRPFKCVSWKKHKGPCVSIFVLFITTPNSPNLT